MARRGAAGAGLDWQSGHASPRCCRGKAAGPVSLRRVRGPAGRL